MATNFSILYFRDSTAYAEDQIVASHVFSGAILVKITLKYIPNK